MKYCRVCHMRIAERVSTCPHCGERYTTTAGKVLLTMLVFIVAVVVCVLCGMLGTLYRAGG